ncbi:hypothetical protein NQZ67_19430 [Paenibacillus sp. SCIV0701]|uniref:Uncharacterized protein n=1 Tax=Paenibacillus soyae TaxID=2969249 RepID=A0A9X2SAB8_9BACL|nr:hypothetical protein [Paenibacillus soyae]
MITILNNDVNLALSMRVFAGMSRTSALVLRLYGIWAVLPSFFLPATG